MLEPHDRRLLLDALRPPEGYTFDEGIGTTFSLDLLALLMAPLGFTMLELQDSKPGEIGEADALLLLKTLRQYADRLTIFCQAGRIAVPRGQGRLLASLEQSVVEVAPPTRGSVFHPKVWALRYTAEDAPVAYRLLVLSRNLTFDRSWDTILVLDGVLRERTNAIAMNHPLGDFVGALSGMAVRAADPRVKERVSQFERELRRVDFRDDLPPGVSEIAFHPLGIEGHMRHPIRGRADRLLVISPFLSASQLDALSSGGEGDDILVSRADELAKLSRKDLDGFSQVFALSPAAVETLEGETEGDTAHVPDVGLHAKVYVADAGREARVWTGSANATRAGFERNVEFLVELVGRKGDLGIDALLAQRDGVVGLRDLLIPYEPAETAMVEDPDAVAAEHALDAARAAIAGVGWTATVTTVNSAHDLVLAPSRDVALPPEVLAVHIHPIMLPESAAKPADSSLRIVFPGLTTTALTSFFAIEVTVKVNGTTATCRFVVNADLIGAPADRREALLRSLLRDRRQVIRFLLLLLADDDQIVHGEVGGGAAMGTSRGSAADSDGAEALLETLLRTLHRHPDRLDEVERLLRDLEATETPDEPLVPPGLRSVLTPILAARGATR
jgi:hypothetical protein